MRLSDAIALGRTIETPGNGHSFCDCAAGLAMAAMGIPRAKRDWSAARKLWPWLNDENSFPISYHYFGVVYGEITLDQLIEMVRSVEPSEDAPSETSVISCEEKVSA